MIVDLFLLMILGLAWGSLELNISATAMETQTPVKFQNLAALAFTLRNTGNNAIEFGSWNTPFDPASPLRHLRVPGGIYSGIAKKRVPSSEPRIRLEAGEEMSTLLRLQDHWVLPGSLFHDSIQWAGRIAGYDVSASLLVTTVAPQRKRPAFTGAAPIDPSQEKADIPEISSKCSARQTAQIKTAVELAKMGTQKAMSCLPEHTCTQAFKTWFGKSERENVIIDIYERIDDAWDYKWTAECDGFDCDDNTYAYVNPDDSSWFGYDRTITFCGAFWRESDHVELANTPVHEMSHFNSIGKTQDYEYGQDACMQLAINDPATAAANADNYGYFVGVDMV